ncbi:hypothetical protein QKW60_05475 [Defluviimonas aestuarii]|uniref:hypothetical protein n=1 Tax=Albidovulum aestuarii TaxID=1130726 RepID=UPI00249B5921|nr:hypothetical protein [Defluviimonas aestuarii]MDI3335846.1 hypothetical protein [Defluviimonas aestuarii]
MEDDEVLKLKHQITMMQEQTAEFADEFSTLSDDQLKELAATLHDTADDASWKANAAETEIRFRSIKQLFRTSS